MSSIAKYQIIQGNTSAIYNFEDSFLQDGIAEVKAYLNYYDSEVLGLEVDYENNTFTRLAGAAGKTAGSDFDTFLIYGGRRLCNLADNGTVNAWYGDNNYTEDGSNGQVMVYQPKFYYKVIPLKLQKQSYSDWVSAWVSGKSYSATNIVSYNNEYYQCITANSDETFDSEKWNKIYEECCGYHLLKARYYITATPHIGFKLHPAFYNEAGNEVDGIYIAAYKAGFYDVSESTNRVYDSWSVTENEGVYTIAAFNTYLLDINNDKITSIVGIKPMSGEYNNLTRDNTEKVANNRGNGWHITTAKTASVDMLLFMIEYGKLNTQNSIGNGVVSYAVGSHNESVFTGSTAGLGNGSGAAASSARLVSDGTYQTNSNNGYKSVRYRGEEDPWGDMWQFENGINTWGNSRMQGGQNYICSDYNYNGSKKDGNYEQTGFTLANADGYIKYFGYGNEKFDWLFVPSKTSNGGNSTVPVGDYTYVTANLNGFRVAFRGGFWYGAANAGAICWRRYCPVGIRSRGIGARAIYVPQTSE